MLKHTHTILIVDDDPLNLKLLERLLKRQFKVRTAEGGETALTILKQEPVSLIITDLQMPGMMGTELLRQSRALSPDIVWLLMTAHNDLAITLDATMKSKALRVINKPWKPEEVERLVEAALARYESRMQNNQALDRLQGAN